MDLWKFLDNNIGVILFFTAITVTAVVNTWSKRRS